MSRRPTMLPPSPASHVRAVQPPAAALDEALAQALTAAAQLGPALVTGRLDHHPATRRERLATWVGMAALLLEELEAEEEGRATWDLELGEAKQP